jgi:drug/metabolite transporter (DMT)-like permease
MTMNRFRADLVLLLVALIWGTAFAVQRVAAQYFDPFTFNGLRFILGGLVLLPFSQLVPWNRAGQASMREGSPQEMTKYSSVLNRKSILYIVAAGAVLFAGSGLQQAGLKYTTAGNAGFITTLYVVLVPIILVIFMREKIHWIAWVSAGIAIIGSLLLSTGGTLQLARGDNLELAGAMMWALDVILVSRAVKVIPVMTFSVGHYIVAGTFNLIVSLFIGMSLNGIATAWWTIVYIGLISTAVGYTLQALGQKYAPPTDATILLSMEAVFAALSGYVFLGETMEFVQLVGCGLIFCAVLITQFQSLKSRNAMMGF